MSIAARRAVRLTAVASLALASLLAGCANQGRLDEPAAPAMIQPAPKRVLEGVPIWATSIAVTAGSQAIMPVSVQWVGDSTEARLTAYIGSPGLSPTQLGGYLSEFKLERTATRPAGTADGASTIYEFAIPIKRLPASGKLPPPLTVIFVNSIDEGPAVANLTVLRPSRSGVAGTQFETSNPPE